MKSLYGGLVAVFLLVGPANAACDSDDLIGRFMIYAQASDRVTRCQIEIKPRSSGNMTRGTPCHQIINGGREINGSVAFGSLFKWGGSSNGSCRIGGDMTIQSAAGRISIEIEHAQMSRDKDAITGIGIDSTGLVFMFSAERIR
jgi:hypothetical protein